ncbi:MAG: hypothetical protein PHD95_02060 [Candidatus ainarchaeum sp.]|nr:hypothetical protein [Candidatus ainarchaeum sp.]
MKKLFPIIFLSIVLLVLLAGCVSNNQAGGLPGIGDSLESQLYSQKCSPSNSSEKIDRLGYLEQKDDVDNETFGFVVCKRQNLNTGEWDVIIQSNIAVGAGLTNAQATEKTSEAQSQGQDYLKFGLPFNPLGQNDLRNIEYRLYQQNGLPAKIELFVVLRNSDRTAKQPKILSVNWPSQ